MGKEGKHLFWKGIWVGGTMTVPGISGGSMAMLLGIYGKLIEAVSGFFSSPLRSTKTLGTFGMGAIVGMVLFSKIISGLLVGKYGVLLRFFFLGAVAGGIPMICRRAGIRRVTLSALVFPLAGILAVMVLALLPETLFLPGKLTGVAGVLFPFAAGILLAAGLVLPGISVSQLLYMLGIYQAILEHIGRLNFLPLLPMGIGGLVGIFLAARLLERLFAAHPQATYLVILGFMLGSLKPLFPGIPAGTGILSEAAAFALGASFVFSVSLPRR